MAASGSAGCFCLFHHLGYDHTWTDKCVPTEDMQLVTETTMEFRAWSYNRISQGLVQEVTVSEAIPHTGFVPKCWQTLLQDLVHFIGISHWNLHDQLSS